MRGCAAFGPWAFCVASALWSSGCGLAPSVGRAPMAVEFAGCQSVLEGPICVLPEDGNIRLWLPVGEDARIVLRVGGRSLEPRDREKARLGTRVTVQVPVQQTPSEDLEVDADTADGSFAWSLALAPPEDLAWQQEAVARLREGDSDGAQELVRNHQRAFPAHQSLVLETLARFEMMTGDPAAGRGQLTEAIESHRASGRLSARSTAVGVLVYHLVLAEHDFVAAREALASMPEESGGAAQILYDRAYYSGILAASVGDRRSALRQMRIAADAAERTGSTDLSQAAEQVLADQLQELGRHREAIERTKGALERAGGERHPCHEAQLLNNLGWLRILARRAGTEAEDPLPALESALHLFENDCSRFPQEPLNVRINLCLAHLDAGRTDAARRVLDELGTSLPEARLALWRWELEGRWALAVGNPERALEHFEEMTALAAVGLSPDAQWRASQGVASAHAARGDVGSALAALASGESFLEAAIRMVPLAEGRDSFLRQRDAGARQHLGLLLAAGRDADALAVALRSRSRALRGLFREERLASLSPEDQARWDEAASAYRARRQHLEAERGADWQLPRDRRRRLEAERRQVRQEMMEELDRALAWNLPEASADDLPRPPHGEVVLLYHPLPEGWVAFALDAETLTVKSLDCLPERLEGLEGLEASESAATSECLLGALSGPLARAETLRVLPYGALRQVDFHALSYGSEVLLAEKNVVYGLDLASQEPADRSSSRRAFVVSDPGGDLPGARAEARLVEKALLEAPEPWEVRQVSGAEATGEALREELPGVDLFHYAGHATFAGLEGWESALPVASGARFEIGDVLTLPRVPDWVVLSGCETGRTARETAGEAVSLAHAFLLTGSRAALATTRPVADEVAREIFSGFYRRWTHGEKASEALRAAQLALRDRDPTADWSSFRIIEN